MGKYFGTDGVRGVANSELTPELAFKLGRFGGYVLRQHAKDIAHPLVLVRVIREFPVNCWNMHWFPACCQSVSKYCNWESSRHRVWLT